MKPSMLGTLTSTSPTPIMESLDIFPSSRGMDPESQSSQSSVSYRKQGGPSKYQFVDLTSPDPTPSPERENSSQSQSSQSSQSSFQQSQSSQASHTAFTARAPLALGTKPPLLNRPLPQAHRSAFAKYPSYQLTPDSAPAVRMTAAPPKDRPLVQGDLNKVIDLTKEDEGGGFGSSVIKSKPSGGSKSSHSSQNRAYADFIRPGTGAFGNSPSSQRFAQPTHRPPTGPPVVSNGSDKPWPPWLTNQGRAQPGSSNGHPHHLSQTQSRPPPPSDEPQGEVFDLNQVEYSQADWERHQGDGDEHMRELLSGAVGDGEDGMGDDKMQEGEDVIEGFADGVRLMPHQVRGVRWMRGRESGRKYGGILADDMGLGKTVQTLARIVEGKATAAEIKAGWKAGTLVIAPLAVMEQWATEVKTKTKPGSLSVTTHHGPSRAKTGKALQNYDVVITTFQTAASEYGAMMNGAETPLQQSESDGDSDDSSVEKVKKKTKPKKKGTHALFDLKWLRVVVDEAQNIKNRKTNAAKAAVALKAKYRWCLTGTPIQNNVEELYSLFHFLRAKPLDNWDVFRARISSLVKDGRTQMAMKRLHFVLKAVMLRRTKDATIDGKPILNLPGRKVEVVHCEFDDEERAFYAALEAKTELTFNKFLKAGTIMHNYTSVLTMLLRLRQACDHPSLVTGPVVADKDAIQNSTDEAEAEDDDLANMLAGLGVDEDERKCEMCFTILTNKAHTQCQECRDLAQKALMDTKNGLPPDSAKIRMLLKLLKDVEKGSGQKEKTIVFSQFTSFMNLIEPFLKAEGIRYVRYDGSMRNDKRQEALETIKTSSSVRVILISFKAGSTGLNLTCCNNVVLMDLWWNPALEDQAFDRAHRLGQKLDVNIWKLTIESTVEDRMLELQTSKRELAAAALSGQATKNVMKLTLNDIMALFRATGE